MHFVLTKCYEIIPILAQVDVYVGANMHSHLLSITRGHPYKLYTPFDSSSFVHSCATPFTPKGEDMVLFMVKV